MKLGTAVKLLLISVALFVAFDQYRLSTHDTPDLNRPQKAQRQVASPTIATTQKTDKSSEPSWLNEVQPPEEMHERSTFRCDGRTRCTQMTSCGEATFFVRNCPGTQMDGDNDGVPCESQWCG